MTKDEEKRVLKDIEETKKIMLRNNPQYNFLMTISGGNHFDGNNKYDSLYTSATEDMATYYQEFKKTTTFLSIGASGEQVINAISCGAKVIDVYDSNSLCRYSTHLRLAALKGLPKEKLLAYYSTFDPRLFAEFAEYLPEDCLLYWFGVYSSFPIELSGTFIKDFLFTYKRLDRSLVLLMNPYLESETYKKTQAMAKDVTINFLDCDLYSLPEKIKDKSYDAMTFSNIYEYINYSPDVTRKKAHQYRNFIMEEMYPHLNEGGTIMVAYLYAWNRRLKQQFDKMHKEHPERLVGTGAISFDKYMDYLQGHTTQNLAYSYLMDAFKNDPIKELQTNHIQYGQSADMSHDMALILKK